MLSKLLPKLLATRLLLMFAIMISIILSMYAWRTAQHESQSRLEVLKSESEALIYQISVSSKRFIITSDFAELENIVLAFAQYPGVEKLLILYDDGTPLVYAKSLGGIPEIDYSLLPQKIDRSMSGTFKQGTKLVSIREMVIGDERLWIQLVRDNREYEQIRSQTLLQSFAWAAVGIIISLLILYWVLRSPMQLLQRASLYARTLPYQHNQSLDIRHGGQEVIDLGNALSSAAKALGERDHKLHKQQVILDTIRQLQSEFIASANVGKILDKLLRSLLDHTRSEYGFIGEVLFTDEGRPYLKTFAITDRFNAEQSFVQESTQTDMELFNLDSLFGKVIKSDKPIIINDLQNYPSTTGLPNAHPSLNAFMGLPVHSGDELVGVIGLANCNDGYEELWMDELKPLLSSCGQLINAYRGFQLRTRMEEDLQDSRRMLLTVLDSIPVRVFWKDLQGRYLGCNQRFAQDANRNHVNEVIGLTDYELPWTKEAEQYRADDEAVIKRGELLINYEESQTTPDGEVHWLQTSKIPLTNNRGETIGILGTYDDITERKLSQDRLKESESRLADAQRIAHLGNWETLFANQEHAEINRWSDQFFRILGLDEEEYQASNELFLKFVHPEDLERVQQYKDLMVENNEDFSYECRIIRQDGEERYLNISAELMHDDKHNVIGLLGTMQDITERKEVEKLKDEFISTVSHELRTPLTSIKGSLGLVRGLATGNELPEKMSNLLDIAHNNTERLLHLINDILDISKIESGQLSLTYSTIRLQEFLEQAVINNQHYAEDVEIILEDDVGDLQVEADFDRLMQIMNNLISNACKFSPEGSRVELGAKQINQRVEISVRDYGDGIPEEYQSKLFEKFTQADSSNTRNFSGSGLGLSITKALVEKHGGYIGFESQQGKGTRFYFVLPILDKSQGNASPPTNTA